MKHPGITMAAKHLPAWVVAVLLLVALLIVHPLPAPAAQPVAFTEYQVKSACLFNFTQFIEWPTNAFTDARSPLVIGILGDDPFGHALEQAIEGETCNKRPIVLQRARRLSDLKGCHVLFISRSERTQLPKLLSQLRGQPIVTVAESDQFAQQGGIIGFVLRENKVRFEINLTAAENAGLKISSQLSKLAAATYIEPNKEPR